MVLSCGWGLFALKIGYNKLAEECLVESLYQVPAVWISDSEVFRILSPIMSSGLEWYFIFSTRVFLNRKKKNTKARKDYSDNLNIFLISLINAKSISPQYCNAKLHTYFNFH